MKERILQKLRRELGAKPTDDPEGVLAVLQVARRLLAEDGTRFVYSALNDAIPMAYPKDAGIAWWAAHHALCCALPDGHKTLGGYVHDGNASHEEVLALFDTAIKNQGTMNIAKSKLNKSNTKGHK